VARSAEKKAAAFNRGQERKSGLGLGGPGSLGLLGLLLSPFEKGEATLTFDDLV
jgi:hypothetical protein